MWPGPHAPAPGPVLSTEPLTRGRRLLRAGVASAAVGLAEGVVWLGGRLDAELSGIWLVAMPPAAAVLVLSPGVALLAVLSGRVVPSLHPGLIVVGAAVTGYATFWLWWFSPAIAAVAGVAIPLLSGAAIGGLPRGPALRRNALLPLLLVGALAVGYAATAFDRGSVEPDVSHQVSLRYWVSVDNKLPEIVGTRLHDRIDLRPEILPGWQSSDRPPLAVGVFLSGFSVGSTQMVGFSALVAAGLLWVLALWSALLALRVPKRCVPMIVLATAWCGPVFVNTVYTWPKITAAALGLLALAAVWEDRAAPGERAALAAAATALAVLSHGSALFAAIALIPFAIVARRAFRWRHLILAVGVMGVLYLPWLLYQRLWDPPGDRLLYWHLAGTSIDSPDTRPFLTALRQEYLREGVVGTIIGKLANVRTLVDPFFEGTNTALSNGSGAWHWIRTTQLSRVLWAPGILLLGIPAAIARWASDRAVRQLLLAAAATTLAYVIVEWGNDRDALAYLYTAPLTILLLSCAALALAVLLVVPERWWPVLLGAVFIAFATTWWWTVGREAAAGGAPGSVRWSSFAIAGIAYAVAAALATLVARNRPRGRLAACEN